MTPTDDSRNNRARWAALLALLWMPWRAGRVVARPPLRVRYFALVGLLWYPALLGGGAIGGALHKRMLLIAPQAALMGSVAVASSTPWQGVAWRIAAGAAAWLVGGVACGAVLVGLGSATLGALLRDRPAGRGLAAAASLFAPLVALAIGMALVADVLVTHGRDWLATALVGALALWPVAGWAILGTTAARHVARPRLAPAWCAAAFALASIAALPIAAGAATLPLLLARWLLR